MRFLISTVIFAGIASAQTTPSPLKGAWRIVEYTTEGTNGSTYASQPGLYLFTDQYFSLVGIAGPKPRPEVDPSKASDAEIGILETLLCPVWNIPDLRHNRNHTPHRCEGFRENAPR